MLAQGVPLLLAGDEVGNSQDGNNNAYCQDNEIGWVDWSGLGRDGDDMTALIARLAELRRRFPQLRPRHWVEGRRRRRLLRRSVADAAGDRDDRAGLEFPEGTVPVLCARPDRDRGASLYIVLNAAPEPIEFSLPGAELEQASWTPMLDTPTGEIKDAEIFEPGSQAAKRRPARCSCSAEAA